MLSVIIIGSPPKLQALYNLATAPAGTDMDLAPKPHSTLSPYPPFPFGSNGTFVPS